MLIPAAILGFVLITMRKHCAAGYYTVSCVTLTWASKLQAVRCIKRWTHRKLHALFITHLLTLPMHYKTRFAHLAMNRSTTLSVHLSTRMFMTICWRQLLLSRHSRRQSTSTSSSTTISFSLSTSIVTREHSVTELVTSRHQLAVL